MDLYLKVREAHFQDGLSGRQKAPSPGFRHQPGQCCEGNQGDMLLAYSEPPGYRRTAPIRRPKLDAFTGQIDWLWLAEDKVRPRKQRHTARERIFEYPS